MTNAHALRLKLAQAGYLPIPLYGKIPPQREWQKITVVTPAMLTALVVGLGIGLLQALTQIQEMTLVFVPKIIAIFVVLLGLTAFRAM